MSLRHHSLGHPSERFAADDPSDARTDGFPSERRMCRSVRIANCGPGPLRSNLPPKPPPRAPPRVNAVRNINTQRCSLPTNGGKGAIPIQVPWVWAAGDACHATTTLHAEPSQPCLSACCGFWSGPARVPLSRWVPLRWRAASDWENARRVWRLETHACRIVAVAVVRKRPDLARLHSTPWRRKDPLASNGHNNLATPA